MSDNVSDERLMELATEALTNSYCPYSNFPVGAALLSKSGKVYKGGIHEFEFLFYYIVH